MDKTGNWTFSPAYDMTFIFNKGGFQPQEERCFMIRGKLMNITKQDAIDFAKDNGIRRPDTIINDVAKAVAAFHELAVKYHIKEEWATRIKACLSTHLADWGFISPPETLNYNVDGHKITNARIEQAYRGNLHLLASIDGKEFKYIFRQGTEEYEFIHKNGIANLSKDFLMGLVEKHLKTKIM